MSMDVSALENLGQCLPKFQIIDQYLHQSDQSIGNLKHKINQWVLIPDWLAGVWQAESEIILESYDYQKACHTIASPVRIKINRISTIGMQRDKHGRIWHYAGTPYHRIIMTKMFKEIQEIEKVELVKVSPAEIEMKFRAKVIRLHLKTNELLGTFIEETETTYKTISDGLNYVTFVISDFNISGQPIYSSKAACIEKRKKVFKVINEKDDENLDLKFREYMLHESMGNLLP
jgi:hypothetical protein